MDTEDQMVVEGALVVVGEVEESGEMYVSLVEGLSTTEAIELLEETIAYLKGERGEVNLQ